MRLIAFCAAQPSAIENYNMCGTARVHDRLQPGGTDQASSASHTGRTACRLQGVVRSLQVHVEGDQFILGDYCMGLCELLAERDQLDGR